jgi:hypothetical protein
MIYWGHFGMARCAPRRIFAEFPRGIFVLEGWNVSMDDGGSTDEDDTCCTVFAFALNETFEFHSVRHGL